MLDGCNCCRVCARRLGEPCDHLHVCDPSQGLVCQPGAGPGGRGAVCLCKQVCGSGGGGDGEGVTVVRVAASICLPVLRGRWVLLGPPGTKAWLEFPWESRLQVQWPGWGVRLPCLVSCQGCCHMCCCAVYASGQRGSVAPRAGIPAGRGSCWAPVAVVVVGAGLCSCFFAQRGC